MATRTTTITRKGQVTIPIALRRALHLQEGDRLSVERDGESIVLQRAESVTDRTAGMLAAYRRDRPLSPAEERAAFEAAVAEEVAASMERR